MTAAETADEEGGEEGGDEGVRVDLRSAPWTRAHDIDPIGSAVEVDRLVTVEVPLPWPADVADLAWLGDLPEVDGVRVQAIVPESAREDGTVLVNRWERDGAHLVGTDWLVAAGEVRAAVAALVAGDAPAGATPRPAPPEILVCSHGARDRCCGGTGTRLAIEIRAALADHRVRRTSHLGGHRFAPTALSLPDGRAWAYLDADTALGVVHRTLDPAQARRHYRGNIGLDPWAQVVEGHRLVVDGWAAFDATTVDADTEVDGDAARVVLRWSDSTGTGTVTGSVVIVRRYPVLQCGLPPEDATKDAPEYQLR